MRNAAVALVLVACHASGGPAAPSNQAAPPDYRKTADDVLGFVPASSEIVLGVDVVQLRRSPAWRKIEPQLVSGSAAPLDWFRSACGFDPLPAIERVTVAITMPEDRQVDGVVVVRGVDGARVIDCVAKQSGSTATVTRRDGVLVVRERGFPDALAITVVAGNTLVLQFGARVSGQTMTELLASGTPLRSSKPFLTLFERHEHTAAAWGVANGSSKAFDAMARMGLRPRMIDAGATVSDRFALAMRMTFDTADQADKLAAEISALSVQARKMVDRFDVRAAGPSVRLDAVVTEDQLRTLIGLLGFARP